MEVQDGAETSSDATATDAPRPAQAPRSAGFSLRSVAAVGFFTLLSRLTGLVREVTKAHFLGTSMAADAFLVAFQIPNVLRSLVGEGAVSSAIVPVLTSYQARESEREHRVFTEKFLSLWLFLVLGITLLGVFLGGPFVELAYRRGSFADPEKIALTARLTGLLFWFLLMIGMSAALQGVLNAHGVFGVPALAPLLFNVGTVACVWILAPSLAPDEQVMAFAAGVLVGGLFQVAVMVPAAWRLGIRPRLRWPFGHAGVRLLLRLLVPATYGAGIYQINVLVGTLIAGRLAETGVVASLGYSSRLMELVLGVFVFALSTVSLTALSRQAAAGDHEGFRHTLGRVLRLVIFITVPSTVGLYLLREPILALLFRRGSFDARSLAMTAAAFQFHVLALGFVGVNRSLVYSFYALRDVRTPVKLATVHLVMNLGLAWALSAGPLGFAGIALASSLSSAVQTVLLVQALRRKVPQLFLRGLGAPLAKVLAASAVMGGAVALGAMFIDPGKSGSSLAVVLLPLIALGAVVYAAAARVLGVEEVGVLLGKLRKRLYGRGKSAAGPSTKE